MASSGRYEQPAAHRSFQASRGHHPDRSDAKPAAVDRAMGGVGPKVRDPMTTEAAGLGGVENGRRSKRDASLPYIHKKSIIIVSLLLLLLL